jgi:hypothetical protein
VRIKSSRAAVVGSVVVLAVAGCGGSSKKSTSSASSASSTPSTTSASTTSTTGSQPLSKAAYEAKLGPLLNDRVGPALKSALANGGATNPQNLKTAVRLINEARNAMASLTPPTKIASLHQQAVTTLGALARDMTTMSDDLQANNKSAYTTAAKAVVKDALRIQSIGNQLSAQGY